MRDAEESKDQLTRKLQEKFQRTAGCVMGEVNDIIKESLEKDIECRPETGLPSLSSRLLSVQEDERKKIAMELHDSLGSLLTSIKMNLENARGLMAAGKAGPGILDNSIYLTRLAIAEVRSLIFDLRPSLLDDLGLIPAINSLCRQVATCAKIHIEKKIRAEENQIPEDLKIVIFRVIQEAFHNIAKYSKANLVELELIDIGDTLELTIHDHGVGFEAGNAFAERPGEKRFGLAIMKERTESSGGSFLIESLRGEGTTIRASWPKSAL
jgi:signal transduction histidine kinase